MITELWLARHGESTGNVAATAAELSGAEVITIDVRDADVPPSATGVEQAQALGVWLAGHDDGIGTAWVSPYLRAEQTLSIAVAEAGSELVPLVDERVRDRELGVLDLLTRLGVERRHPDEAERRRRLGKYYHRPPGGESWADVRLRLRAFLTDELPPREGGALIVAHDAVVLLIVSLLTAMHEREILDFAAEHTVLNASITHLAHDGVGWVVRSFSDAAARGSPRRAAWFSPARRAAARRAVAVASTAWKSRSPAPNPLPSPRRSASSATTSSRRPMSGLG